MKAHLKSLQKRLNNLPSPPRFALPEHQWIPRDSANARKSIREHNGWVLVKRWQSKPSAERVDKQLKAPGTGLSAYLEKKFPSGKLFKKTHIANDILKNLTAAIEVRLALKQPSEKQIAEIHDAVGILFWLVSRGCRSLMEIAKQNPQCLEPIASKQTSWPLMMSTKPGYSADHIPLLNSIHLGKASDWDMERMSRADIKRSPAEIYMKSVAEKLFHTLHLEWLNKGNTLNGEAVPYFSYDDKVFEAWWEAAKSIFLEAYPKPHEQPELAQYASPSRKAPAHKRASILRKIRTAFSNLALHKGP